MSGAGYNLAHTAAAAVLHSKSAVRGDGAFLMACRPLCDPSPAGYGAVTIGYNLVNFPLYIARNLAYNMLQIEEKVVSGMDEFTRKYNAAEEKDEQIRHVMTSVYEALQEKGYNPINQIVGYILSEDPTYITNHNGARSLICKIDRDELLQVLVANYLDI